MRANNARSPLFETLGKRRAFEEIIEQIEQAITDGRLKAGDKLPSERELTESFGVSRSSVREALRALEMFGVVVVQRGAGSDAGSIVTPSAVSGITSAIRLHAALTRIPIEDLVDIRVLLEGFAAQEAALNQERDLKPLRDLIEDMEMALAPNEFHISDTAFHVELARASGNALAPALMESLRGSMSREMLRRHNEIKNWEAERVRLVSEHEAIVRLIEAGDAQGAATAVAQHIIRYYRRTGRNFDGRGSQLADGAAD